MPLLTGKGGEKGIERKMDEREGRGRTEKKNIGEWERGRTGGRLRVGVEGWR